ncbi:cysteine--tRNA ligase [Candidatus Falkowbacteria bacterium RIFOXYB2_FULL_38_15]|uniref:Cysteine--tRNA ligase n=1 Tax=Candidatus Falkowbacteria bacterium RIFOXYA2_FULL_38_12 TaxID=1797993 RepID=A0A1F5S1P5_9BACT|nr:MAG: cysteine--tRNA ligase [Candidatus Falkowbacteria bacterium RIFOXYA2_FULL_38_12]OGF32921.1 MAG: cysteine--tRNA ligase [Candidatus Falkowbacteria bacterium RIFOXYB2_FULL_38_15]OGF44125.1 MAG: cysteine--tRNA ligase [Candidatus Falkowbacteria bacterium RIFOXYD2_FULL_39_16]
MNFYNTLSKKIENFKPQKGKTVKIYTCGPTVYNYAHIGNLRAYIFDDILIRALLYNGYKVDHVINLTDIGHLTSDADAGEDKMMKALAREGFPLTLESMKKIAEKYTVAFQDDLKKLNIFEYTENKNYKITWAKASDHIKEQIDLVKILVEKGFAYETDQAIYFDVKKFPDYGKLTGQKLEEKKTAVRKEVFEDKDKKNQADFALWFKRAGRFAGHVMYWPSPWGDGFPGWHIECSAMAMKYLGETLDIHTGGVDHISVHHTNEIAQSEAATGKTFSRFWMHNEFIVIGKDKMAKSAGTFITLNSLIEKGLNPLAYRYFCLGAHYRQQLNFSFEAVGAAENALNNLYSATIDLKKGDDIPAEEEFKKLLDNDLGVPEDLAVVWKIVKTGNGIDSLLKFDEVLGFDIKNKIKELSEIPEKIKKLLEEREEARKNKDWVRADEIRKRIEVDGYNVLDTAEGQKIKLKVKA